MVEIRVSGSGEVTAPAEHADVQLRVAFSGPSAASVLQSASDVHTAVVERAKALVASGAAQSWFAERIMTSSIREWQGEGQERRTVFHASAQIRLRVTDLEALGGILGELGVIDGLAVDQVAYGHGDETAARLASASRAAAIADAIARARDFADAAALGVPRIVQIDEGGEPERPRALMAMARGGGAGAAPTFELQAEDLRVTTDVRVTFDTTPVQSTPADQGSQQ